MKVNHSEQVLQFEVTTAQHAAQARRKLDALILGGYEILSIHEREVWDEESGQRRRIRSVRVYGKEVRQNPESQQ